MALQKAQRKRLKGRIGLSGPSGSGKTYSALLLAHGLTGDWSKIAVIDSEVGSSNNYAHLGEFLVNEIFSPYTPESYVKAIKECEDAGVEVIIIDSTSHEWDGKGGCLEINDNIAKTKFKGNTWAAWSEVTPRHQKFIEAITTSKCHIITTARSKTDTIQTDDGNGKKSVKKVGMKDIQREGFEYELTLMFNIDRDTHTATTSKDRTSLFIDRDPFVIDSKIGEELRGWLESGVDAEALEAERKKQEEASRLEKEKKEKEERDTLYNSILAEIQDVKFIDDLAAIWNTKVNPSKLILGESYLKDLTERKDAIKEQLSKVPAKVNPPAAEEKKTTPKDSPNPPKTNDVSDTVPPVSSDISQEKTAEPPASEEPENKAEEKDPTVEAFSGYIEKIRATTNVEELEEAWLEVETALGSKKITLQQHGVLASHKGIMLKKFPNQ